ncbi:MAG: hypothetical protein J5994_10310 [Ruminococcus sp.]|nr:hypothetical protein [Ruminococcus sp.]
MTPEDWAKVEKALSNPFNYVNLKIDGYNVMIGHALEKPLKYCLAVYIDCEFKMEWALSDCDIRRRFFRRRTKSLLTAKEKKALKRERKDFQEKIKKESTIEWYEPCWSSFKSLKSHLIKNNKSIEFVEAY